MSTHAGARQIEKPRLPHTAEDRRPRGRRSMYTSYAEERSLLNTPAKRAWTGVVVAVGVSLVMVLEGELLVLIAVGLAAGVGAIGLNLVTGYAGQISLGHAFFLGVGAYTASVLGGQPGRGGVIGWGLDGLIWLPAAGIVAGLLGAVLAPVAVRLRGLYLAVVTLGLTFLGVHFFSEFRSISGGAGLGRSGPSMVFFGTDLGATRQLGPLTLSADENYYLFVLLVLILLAVAARNLARSRFGRAFAAVRDRDVAAEIMGVDMFRTKLLAFAVSSAYAGVAGALLAGVQGFIEPTGYGLLMSIMYLVMILLGGMATVSGAIVGALFISLLPRITQTLAHEVSVVGGPGEPGMLLTVFQLEQMLYGLLIVAFVLLEPAGLVGVWRRICAYWRGFPFTY